MAVDRQGLELTGSAEAVAAYDRAMASLVRFQPEVVAAAAEAAAGGCVMGTLLGAYLGLMSTEEGALAAAREALGPYATEAADEGMLKPRERAHLAAARRWIAGDMAGAGALLSGISIEYPKDLLALSVGHQIDFFRGDAINLRDRIGRALVAWTPDEGATGFLYGMYAFGLEECNQYGQAADAGGQAIDRNPDDVWGIHAVVHHSASEDVALELLDATALLWRLHLEGTSVGDRWRPLASAWTRILRPGFYPFNDMHAIMAYVGTGELDRARAVVTALERVVSDGDRRTTGWEMTSAVGLPVCRSMLRFGTGEYTEVLDDLLPIRTRVHEFGGSHAQRDAVERTILEAAIRAGRQELADALVSERLANRECSTYAWSKRALLLSRIGAAQAAAAASARQRELTAEIQAAAQDPDQPRQNGPADLFE